MKKRIILTILLVLAFLYFATLFYKTIIVMLLVTVWKNKIRENLPERVKPWGMKAIWICLALTLWVAMPRYRIHSDDRVRFVYLDEQGNARHAPLLHYAANTLLPEEEIVNFGITNLRLVRPVLQIFKMNLGTTFINQAIDESKEGKLTNFFKPYRRLGLENPMSGVYPQFFNQCLGGDSRAVYICDPKGGKAANEYPLVVFCHGYLGNWQLYQGIWKDLEDCIVLSIGTNDLRGIFSLSDIKSIFDFYIPALERMDCKYRQGPDSSDGALERRQRRQRGDAFAIRQKVQKSHEHLVQHRQPEKCSVPGESHWRRQRCLRQ